jgi:hypothetical protein
MGWTPPPAASVCQNRDTGDALINTVGDICHLYHETECWNFFKTTGYVEE